MKLYFLESPKADGARNDYATFSHLGTWTDGGLCEGCGRSLSLLTEPLMVEWDPGSSNIGDFSYRGYSVLAGPAAIQVLVSNEFELDYRVAEVVPPESTSRRRAIVPYPYVGPKLVWIYPRATIPLDPAASSAVLLGACEVCRHFKWQFLRSGIVINSSDWNGERTFRISQFVPSGAIVITQEGADLLSSAQLSNLGLHEVGKII